MYPLLLVFLCFSLSTCSPSAVKGNGVQNENYSDFSYSGLVGKAFGPNGNGKLTGLEELKGSFIWVDYAAPWCSACTPQTQIIKKLSDIGIKDVIFLTVLTSGADALAPSTEQTAKQWAARFGLSSSLVVAEGQSSRNIPQHALFSPLGQTLYRNPEFLSAEKILSILEEKRVNWNAWHRQNLMSQ